MITDVLKKLREMRGYTMKEVAEGIGAKPDTYRSYERGRLQPSLEIVAKLAKFYRISANCLLEIDPITDIEYNDEFESELIEQYKQLPKDIRATILQAILNAAQKCNKQEEPAQSTMQNQAVQEVVDNTEQIADETRQAKVATQEESTHQPITHEQLPVTTTEIIQKPVVKPAAAARQGEVPHLDDEEYWAMVDAEFPDTDPATFKP